ncbi:MAG: C-terminal target protein [Verrucomicrobiales bacterium]|nr:C-terminal target protein [Verrucomicrobiales bacterium]
MGNAEYQIRDVSCLTAILESVKKIFCWLLLSLVCVLTSKEGRAAAPANDLCSGALVIPSAGPFPYLTQVITNISEATITGDPVLSCSANKSRSVWFRFSPAVSGTYAFSTAADTATTLPDTVMGLYSGNNCSSGFTERYCADDEPGDMRAAFSTNLTAGTMYFIVVWIYDVDPPVAEQDWLQLRVSKPATPANDLCSGAQTIPSLGPFPYLTPETDITFATTINDPPMSDCQFTNYYSRSVWYKFVPSNTVAYTFSTCSDTGTTVQDTILAVYKSANGCTGPLTAVACNDGACSANRSMVSAMLTNGQTYYVVAWEFGTNAPVAGQTLMQLKVTVPPPVLTTVQRLTINSYRVTFAGFPGQVYSVEASTNLLDWVTVGTPTNLGGANYQLTLTNANAPQYRFFRAIGP